MLKFGDYLSNALHDIKRFSGKKISVVMDELGYGFEPELSGDTIESWRYRKAPPTLAHLETLARLIIGYKTPQHDDAWLDLFLKSADHPYPQALQDELFPQEPDLAENDTASHPVQPIPLAKPPSLKAYSPPIQSGFVGRSAEIKRYSQLLENQTFAVITGMAGVGKTSLMSTIGSHWQNQPVFWHSFASGTADSLASRLAGFVANFGRPELWEMFESARVSGGRSHDTGMMLDMLAVVMSEFKEGMLLCLDDLQFVDEDPRIKDFLPKLLQSPSLYMLVTARRFPSFLPTDNKTQLNGLTVSETAELLHGRSVELAPDLIERLNQLTGGNGAFLTLASVILKNSRNHEEIIGRLAREEDIERFLMEEVNDRLESNEQRVMEAVGILSGYVGTREVIEAMLNMRDVRRALRDLSDQHLLLIDENDDGERIYKQHQIVQTFFYEQPRKAKRREMHGRAADFYEFEEPEPFRAMLHHAKAGQHSAVMSLANQHYYDVLNMGHGHTLSGILADVDMMSATLSKFDIVRFLLARGRLSSILGENQPAEVDLKEAAEMLQNLPRSVESDTLKGDVCLAMGELLERQDPSEALRWVQRGLEVIPADDRRLSAELKTLSGTLNMHMGNFGGALEDLMDGLEHVPEDNRILHLNVLKNLGAVYVNLGNLEEAAAHTAEALQLSRQLKDHNQTARILINLGPIRHMQGDWRAAVADLEQGLEKAERLGNPDATLSLLINLGGCFVEMGDFEKAHKYLDRGIEMGQGQAPHQLIPAYIRLAELFIKERNWMEADEVLQKAETLAQAMNDQAALASIYGIWGLQAAGINRLDKAMQRIAKAIGFDRMLGDTWSLGLNLRIQGHIAALRDDVELMHRSYLQSIENLSEIDSFQAAVSGLEYGIHLHAIGDSQQAKTRIRESHETLVNFADAPEFSQASKWLETESQA